MGHEKKVNTSAYLDVEMSTDQSMLLNPTTLDTVVGFVMKDAQGKWAKKKIPKRRLNLIDSQVSAHCVVLNDPARLDLIKQTAEVAAVLGDLENDRLRNKSMQQIKKKQDEADKEKRRMEKQAKAAQKKQAALVSLTVIVPKMHELGPPYLKSLTVPQLKDIIIHHYNLEYKQLIGLVRKDVLAIALRLYMDENRSRDVSSGEAAVWMHLFCVLITVRIIIELSI